MSDLFFGVDIAKEIGDAMKSTDLPNFTLIKNPTTSRQTGNQAAGVASTTFTSYPIHGSVITFDVKDLEFGQQIESEDVCLVIIAKPLNDLNVKIELNDFVVVDGKRRSVVWAKRDGAKAHWKVQLR